MKKKLLISLMSIAVVVALAGVGVYAYFSDTETSTGNTFTAGTLDLVVDDENPWASTVITTTCWAPGNTTSNVTITAKNTGCLDGDLFMNITAVTDAENGYTEPECSAYGGSWNNTTQVCTGGSAVNNLSTQITLGVWCDSTAVTGINGVTLAAANDVWSSKIADLAQSGTASINISATFASGAGNEYQSDSTTFTITLYLAQDGQSHP